MKKVCDFIARWMGALVLLLALFSLFFPPCLSRVGTWVINPMLGLIMFGMGLTLNPSDFRVVFSRPKDVLTGCLAQFTVMPLLAWLLAKLFGLPADLALGVILVGCCPGGTASNVITYLAKGDLALSVGMTATSTVLAPVLTPLLTWLLAGTFVDVDAWGMLQSILYVVIAPILAGFLIQKFLPGFTRRAVAYLPAFSSLMIALLVSIIVAHNASKLLTGGLLVVLVVVRWACRTADWPLVWLRFILPLSRWPPFRVQSSVCGTTSAVPWWQNSTAWAISYKSRPSCFLQTKFC